MQKLIAIVGPTASGKSDLGVKIAKRVNGEVISADSRQVYRGMDIGTGKITKKEMKGIPHHLLNIASPKRDFNVSHFKKLAENKIEEIISRGHIPIIVGGTGLYISALVDNLEIPKVKENEQLRQQLEKEIEEKGLAFVFDKLVELDSEAAYIVDPNNPRRIIRALEIAFGTGKLFSDQRKKGKLLFDFLQIGINQSPEILKLKIGKRVHEMLKNGLTEEVKKLVKKYGEKCKAFDAIGYREIIDYLNSRMTINEAEELMKKNTWRYAKRQMTWFNKDKRVNWINDPREAEKLVLIFLG